MPYAVELREARDCRDRAIVALGKARANMFRADFARDVAAHCGRMSSAVRARVARAEVALEAARDAAEAACAEYADVAERFNALTPADAACAEQCRTADWFALATIAARDPWHSLPVLSRG